MVLLSEATWERVKRLFPPDKLVAVEQLLVEECGENVYYGEDPTPEKLERIRFAVLKLSEGSFEGLKRAVALARRDWRDVLMAARFGEPHAHEQWWPEDLRPGAEGGEELVGG